VAKFVAMIDRISLHATAPNLTGSGFFDVPDVRVHVWPQTGSVACPATPVAGQQCYAAGTPDGSTVPSSSWDHLVIVTGDGGNAVVDWTLAGGDNTLLMNACGVARRGPNEPNPPSEPGADEVWGDLAPNGCDDREAALTNASAYDNGPADGDFPYEPTDFHEVAIYGLPLTFVASTCSAITIDGTLGNAEWDCAQRTDFTVNLPGSVIEGEVERPASPVPPPPTPPTRDTPPDNPPPPSWFRSARLKVRIVQDQFVALELSGSVDFETALWETEEPEQGDPSLTHTSTSEPIATPFTTGEGDE